MKKKIELTSDEIDIIYKIYFLFQGELLLIRNNFKKDKTTLIKYYLKYLEILNIFINKYLKEEDRYFIKGNLFSLDVNSMELLLDYNSLNTYENKIKKTIIKLNKEDFYSFLSIFLNNFIIEDFTELNKYIKTKISISTLLSWYLDLDNQTIYISYEKE